MGGGSGWSCATTVTGPVLSHLRDELFACAWSGSLSTRSDLVDEVEETDWWNCLSNTVPLPEYGFELAFLPSNCMSGPVACNGSRVSSRLRLGDCSRLYDCATLCDTVLETETSREVSSSKLSSNGANPLATTMAY